MELTVAYNNTNSSDEAYEIAKGQITPEYIAKWNVKAEVSFDDDAKYIEAQGKGFTLSLSFGDSECEIGCKLSLLLKPLKKTILDTIQKKLERHI